jgi:inorganic triphosphatase YgiF
MSMQKNREFELKLTLTAPEYARLAKERRLPASASDKAETTLTSVYYDTPDHRLHDLGLSLRVRCDGKSFAQTAKADAKLKTGISNPLESEAKLSSLEPDLDRVGDKRLRRELRAGAAGSVLTQAFETVVKRRSYKLRRHGSLIELALDRGEARAKDRNAPICEAELELIKGNPKDLLEVAQELFSRNEVRLSSASKAECGYELLLGTVPEQEIRPSKAEKPDVACGQTCGEAFAAIFRSAAQQIIANRTVVQETDEPEGAHQLRVGLTRLRSAHRALKPIARSPSFNQLEADAHAIVRVIGQLRDADVLIEDIYAPVAGATQERGGFDALLQALQSHRTAMQEEARQILRGERWSRLLLSLTLWPDMLQRDPSLQERVEDYASKALQKRWRKVAKSGRAIGRLEPAERHKMRRSLKKLRYMSEFFAPLYSNKDVTPFIKKLKKLQDVFGYVNDVRTARQLRSIAIERREGLDCAIAAGIVLGTHEKKAEDVWQDASGKWQRLEATGRFWR